MPSRGQVNVKPTLKTLAISHGQSPHHALGDTALTNAEITQVTAVASGVTETVDGIDAQENGDEMYDTMRMPETAASGTFDLVVRTPQTQSVGTIGAQAPRAKRVRPESAIP